MIVEKNHSVVECVFEKNQMNYFPRCWLYFTVDFSWSKSYNI
jgi:hypothetical protein